MGGERSGTLLELLASPRPALLLLVIYLLRALWVAPGKGRQDEEERAPAPPANPGYRAAG